jgi:hypothetical protein
VSIRLTRAQRSGLECAGLDVLSDPTPAEAALADAWCGSRLVVSEANRDLLFEAVNDRSNAEDAAGQDGDALAARAAKALGNLASKIVRIRLAVRE